MEDTLRGVKIEDSPYIESLNPCFNGRYSQRQRLRLVSGIKNKVLILVLMEDTLRA